MSHNLKPGDLVLIVGATTDTRNIGKTAELVELVPPQTFSCFLLPQGIRASHDEPHACWLLAGGSLIQEDASCNGFGIRSPRFLMPLRGDFAPERQKAKEAQPCL